MVSRAAVLGALMLSGSCSKPDGSEPVGPAPSNPDSAARTGRTGSSSPSGGASSGGTSSGEGSSGGGFSADLAKEIGSGSAATNDGARPASEPAGGSNVGAPAAAPAIAAEPPRTASGSAATEPPPRTAAASAATEPPPRTASGSAATEPLPRTAAASAAPAAMDPVKVPTDLAAIKISLLPNWDRDVGEPGTFQYVVRIKGTQSFKTFLFHYGYDDPKAPTDRDQYKKYLQDSKLLLGEIKDRQRGSAWFLEGADASGLPAFRYVVLYGGKHLICYGSLYKGVDSNRLGDDRDQTVIQAKQICETLAL
jgi:hypothetical protein